MLTRNSLFLIVCLVVGTGLVSSGCNSHHSTENSTQNEVRLDNTPKNAVADNSIDTVPEPGDGFYNIPDFAHISAVNCNRGHGHDKQPFGVQLKADGTFQVKQTNMDFGKNVTVEFLHYASGAGPTLSIPSNGDTVSWTNNTGRIVVPVLRGQTAPENGEAPALEFEKTEEMIDLTIWNHEKAYPGGATQFYIDWERNSLQTNDQDTNDGYAMILSPRINFLVHVFDKYDMSTSSLFDDAGLAKWLNYYTDLINQFDDLLGLDGSQPWNKRADIRYFCKPHQGGAGAAYYTNSHIAMSRKSLRQRTGPINTGFFLIGWWGGSHEIAHGYEGDARGTLPHSAQYSGTAEVWNNFYTIMTWDSPAIKDKYLPGGYGARFDDADKFMARVKEVGFPGLGNSTIAGKSDFERKLYFFVSLYQSLGKEFFINYNQEIRRMAHVNERESGSPSRFAKYFGAVNKVNLIPYFEYWGLEINQETRDYVQSMNYKGMAVIESVIMDTAIQDALISRHGLNSKFNLISNERLRGDSATRGITGSATVNIAIDNLDEIKDKKWYLMDGHETVREGTIRDTTIINITRVNLGAYTLRMPTTESAYIISQDNATILIKQDSPAVYDIKYDKAENPFTKHKRVNTIGDYTNFTFDIRPDNVSISGPPNRRVTRSGGSGIYTSIEVLDAAGQRQNYQEWLRNTHYSPENIQWRLQEGWQVKIYHLEPGSITRDNRRRTISNGFTGALEDDTITNVQSSQTVIFTIKNGEIMQEGLTEQQRLDILKKQLDVYATGTLPNRNAVSLLLAGIDSLPEPYRTEYMHEYKDIVGR